MNPLILIGIVLGTLAVLGAVVVMNPSLISGTSGETTTTSTTVPSQGETTTTLPPVTTTTIPTTTTTTLPSGWPVMS